MGGHILVDDRWIGRHGIGRFAAEVIRRLDDAEGLAGRLPSPPLHPLDPWRLAREVRRRRPDVFFTPGFNPPWHVPCPFVFCLHDMVHLDVPAESTPLKRLYYGALVAPAARRAAAILTLSEASRARIVARLGVPVEMIRIVGCGVEPVFTPDGPRVERTRPYLLYVGNLKPHKNFRRTAEAFARSRATRDHDLVAVAHPTTAARRHLAQLGLEDRVEWRSGVDDADLAALYRGADALLQISLVEGFGLPLLEALASGTPALIADASALPEVAGKAALAVDPLDVESITAGIDRILGDEALRRELSARGLAHAAAFTWERTAGLVRQALDKAAAGANG